MGTVLGGDARPFSAVEWMISLRYLRARRKEGFISVIAGFSFLGILLGVATLIIVMSVLNGFRKELFDKILGLNGHVIVRPLGRNFNDYDDVAARLRQVEGVRLALSVVEAQALLTTPVRSSGALVRGLTEADLRSLEAISGRITSGTLNDFESSGGVAIGARLANALGLHVNDEVSILSPRGTGTPFGVSPRVKRYPVRAIFEIGMSEYDASFVFMPLEEAQTFFNSNGAVDVLEVMVDDPDRVEEMRIPLGEAAGADMLLSDWRERNETFYNTLNIQRNMMFIILTLIVLVAALNIISGLIMLVKDKGRDVAILRTMGATQGAVMRIFFITGVSIGVTGTLCGLLLGVLFCNYIDQIRQAASWLTGAELFPPEVYFLKQMPASINLMEVGAVVLMALSLSVLATLYPSWRAARLDPVEALRYA
jgi:lipoprotein-releasing system permease protein